MKTIHIARDRYQRIRRQTYEPPAADDFRLRPDYKTTDGEVTFHLMDTEREFCATCRTMVESVQANTPLELYKLMHEGETRQ